MKIQILFIIKITHTDENQHKYINMHVISQYGENRSTKRKKRDEGKISKEQKTKSISQKERREVKGGLALSSGKQATMQQETERKGEASQSLNPVPVSLSAELGTLTPFIPALEMLISSLTVVPALPQQGEHHLSEGT